jgi:hypothetical protein
MIFSMPHDLCLLPGMGATLEFLDIPPKIAVVKFLAFEPRAEPNSLERAKGFAFTNRRQGEDIPA